MTTGCDSDNRISGCRLSERNEKLNQDSFSDKSKKWQCGRCHDVDAKTSPSRIMVLLFKSLGRLPTKIPQLSTPLSQGHAFFLRGFCWMIDHCLGHEGLCLSSRPRTALRVISAVKLKTLHIADELFQPRPAPFPSPGQSPLGTFSRNPLPKLLSQKLCPRKFHLPLKSYNIYHRNKTHR